MCSAEYLVIGQGQIGTQVANLLANLGHTVTGLARKQRQHYAIVDDVGFIQADALTLTGSQISQFTHIAIIVTPDNYTASDYQTTYLGIAKHIADLNSDLPNLQRIVFISSTGVYGQDNGEWIDETVDPVLPSRPSAQYILQAEQVLQQAYQERAVIVRASGIYGIDRLVRIKKAKQDIKEPLPRYAWTNRIMDSDLVTIIVKILSHSVSKPDSKSSQTKPSNSEALKPLYLATDFMPVTSFRLIYWLSEQLGTTLPSAHEADEIGESSASGKRLHSNVPKSWLKYPDWQIGYSKILKEI